MSRRTGIELTRETLIAAFEHVGFKVTSQSTDGTWKLLRLPDGTPTDYWIFGDRLEHKLSDSRGGSCFYYSECKLEADDKTVAVVCALSERSSIYAQFHNFEVHKQEYKHNG